MRVRVHGVAALVQVLDEAQVERTSSILVALELVDCRVGRLNRVKPNHARALGATTRLVLDLGLFNLAYCREEIDQVLIAS